MRQDLTDVERQVMGAVLRGDHPTLLILQEQLRVARVARRNSSTAGFFSSFHIPSAAPRPSGARNLQIDDVFAMVEGLKYGAGFILYVRDGVLDEIEGYTFGEDWPENPKAIRVFYVRHEYGTSGALVETDERDFSWLEQSGKKGGASWRDLSR